MSKMSAIHATAQGLSQRPFTRRDFLSTSLKAGAAAFTTGLLPRQKANAQGSYNVLFFMVDDLRPLLGCYGYPQMHTPNIDALAARGTLFTRAYCQYPMCNPSRTSMITGLRPNTTNVYNNASAEFRKNVPDAVTFPQHFKEHSYHTQSVGKLAHSLALQDDAYSWSVPSWALPITKYGRSHPSWLAPDVEDDELSSGKTAKRAVAVLKKLQNTQFFLAVGFHTPHLPFYAPKRYHALYKNEDFSLPSSSSLPANAPSTAIPNLLGNMRLFQDIPDKGPLSDMKALELMWAYAASISYMDAQVGRVLNQLDALQLTERTVIVFASDHGFHLGEHGKWGKNTLFEVSLRSPLIISVPGQTYPGVQTGALAELVDIYPTLCDACQLPTPSQLEGLSLLPLIQQPARPWKTAAFSQTGGATSMRTERYRYTEWGRKGKRGMELYDYEVDPDESVNVAELPENAELVTQLSEQLRAGWRAALPDVSEHIPLPQTLPWDVNSDGVVDIQDLIVVSNSFGVATAEHPKVDLNRDGRVDIIDLLLVAAHFGELSEPTAPAARLALPPVHVAAVESWLAEARLTDDGSHIFRRGMAALEGLLNSHVPEKTALLPNYPNPFNPETWMPYDLAEDANVHIRIYNLKGESIRALSLGFQTAGTYRIPSRAAYWDGCNASGEPVASGIYFWTLTAHATNRGRSTIQFTNTRRMAIVK